MKVKKISINTFYTDLPDVDVDFSPAGRDLVKDYIKNKYGHDYSCSVGTYTRMQLKTCIKDFAKVRNLPFDYVNKITKDIDDQIEYDWGDLISYATKSKTLFKFIQDYPEIVHATKYSMKSCKAESVHPSAVIIVPKISHETGKKMNIYEWMPIKKIDGLLVSEWEGKYTEAGLFLKEDILGLNQLDKFHGIIQLIKKHYGKDIDVNKIPFDDEEVFRFFRKGWCEDVFQFGTMSLMNYCKQVKPTEFSDLVAMTALFRPGPIASHAHLDFADIKNGKKKPKFDYGIENITGETYSLLVYQEQMMSIIHQLGGLSLIEAENARKYIKKKKHKELAALGDDFIKGAMNNGCPEDEAKKIWDKMNAFSAYSFNKSHAVAYTLMSYWSQWFKVNYPLEFWTTSLQEAKNESVIPYRLAEMKKVAPNIEIRQPDINYSSSNFTCDPENNRIFYSLQKIKGVGEVAVKNIVETRDKDGQFFSLDEFISRVPSKVNKTNVKWLIVSGAFDLVEGIEQPRDRRKLLQKYLIEIKGDKQLPDEYNTEEAKISNAFWILEQKRLTGFGDIDYLSMMPNKRMKRLFITAADFSIAKEETEAAIAGNLLSYTEREIKTGKMCNISISSSNEIINCTLWPDAYEPILESVGGDMLDIKGKVICISGVVRKDKFRNNKTLYSDRATKLYILS
nr:MAG TPA: DNA polymerase III, alpha subunit [Caudoviricetes sp.]